MIVVENFNSNTDPIENLNLGRFSNVANDVYLFVGNTYDKVFEKRYMDKKRIFLSLEEPNFCTDKDTAHAKLTNGYGSTTVSGIKRQDTPPDKILSLCPYTTKSLPNNRELIFFPFNEEFIPKDTTKEFDVLYTGSKPINVNWDDNINVIKDFNYQYAHYDNTQYVTNSNVSYIDKINLYSKSKIAICHGLASAHNENVPRYINFINSENNEAFKHLDKNLLPQFKSRVMEAAFSKSLILCYKDYWNVIEYWFEPNKQFIYFDNSNDLRDKLNEILNNYAEYQHIIDSAYEKAINNYTTKHFIEKYIGLK
jgi:hypothetical protein